MWYHGAGNEVESRIINQIVDDFNASQSDWTVSLESFPQGAYNDSVVAAALAGNLPCMLDVDGPNMPNWAWSGYMQPLPIDEVRRSPISCPAPRASGTASSIRSACGTPRSRSTPGKSTLDELGLRTPTLDKPWTGEEFMAALDAAKASGKFDYRARSRHERPGRMVSLCLLAVPAELRRRHRRPLHLRDRRGRAERRRRDQVRRVVAEAVRRRLRAGHQRGPGRPADRLHRRQVRLPVERQLARRRHDGRGG